MTSYRRPGPLRWLWYAFGGGLPPAYREWVLHDATCRTWRLRHLARTVVQVSLLTIPLIVFLPGALWVRLAAALLGWLVALQYSLFIMDGAVESRVRKAGYPPGHADAVRDAATAEQRSAAAVRYAARYRT